MVLGDFKRGVRCTLDLDRVVFDGEVEMRRALLADKRFKSILDRAESPSLNARRHLLLSALRLTEKLSPEVFGALSHIQTVLGLETPVEVYCVSDSEINAFVVPPERGKLLMGITSTTLEQLDNEELRFVIGHEMGHAVFDHFQLSPDAFLDDDQLAPIHIARLCAWMRYAELSADRVGLLSCDDFDAAVRAFFKLTSGLSGARFIQHASECATQYADVKSEHLENSEDDWFSTHPYSPLRIKALDAFSRSVGYHELCGRNPEEAKFHRLLGGRGQLLDKAALGQEVRAVMQVMDPSFLRDDSDVTPKVREYLALAGYAVALADGSVARGEKKALGKLVGKRGVSGARKALAELSEQEHTEKMAQLGGNLKMKLGRASRHKIIEDLVTIALADRELQEAEVEAIALAAEQLGVGADVIQHTLARLAGTLD